MSFDTFAKAAAGQQAATPWNSFVEARCHSVDPNGLYFTIEAWDAGKHVFGPAPWPVTSVEPAKGSRVLVVFLGSGVGNPWVLSTEVGPPVDASPVGTIVDYINTTPPTGWLAMIGQTITDGQTLHPNLWEVLPSAMKSGADILMPDTRGRVTVGYNSGDEQFDSIGETGGAKTHTLTTEEMPAHQHRTSWDQGFFTAGGVSAATTFPGPSDSWDVDSEGGGEAHNNLQPYVTFLKIIRVGT